MAVKDFTRRRILSIVGTRPEAIKIAPLALAATARDTVSHEILATGQHDLLFDEALAAFGLASDYRLAPIARHPSPDVMVERLTRAILSMLPAIGPDIVIVQGDTNSALAGALAACRLGLPIAHVEAGLRSHDFAHPWPEERNRVAIDHLADWLFAPTAAAATNLRNEPEVRGLIVVTGNTGIDALLAIRERLPAPSAVQDAADLVFLTCHRRENIGEGIRNICTAALRLADRGDIRLLCPVHPNPAVGSMIRERLGHHPAITLTGALGYRETVEIMASATLILTDSGGIQEEAPALGVPTLVLRDVTERPEALASGNLALVGTDPDRIVAAASRLLDDPMTHAAMARPSFPFGRGDAAEKILDALEQYFSSGPCRDHPLPFTPSWIMDGGPKGA